MFNLPDFKFKGVLKRSVVVLLLGRSSFDRPSQPLVSFNFSRTEKVVGLIFFNFCGTHTLNTCKRLISDGTCLIQGCLKFITSWSGVTLNFHPGNPALIKISSNTYLAGTTLITEISFSLSLFPFFHLKRERGGTPLCASFDRSSVSLPDVFLGLNSRGTGT